MTSRIVVLASGTGTNLVAILDAIASGRLCAHVEAVISDRPDAPALRRALEAHRPTVALKVGPGEHRQHYDQRLAGVVRRYEPDLIVLAGWMRLLSMSFLGQFPGRVVNLHPALPGEFPGLHAVDRAYAASRAGTIDRTGVMVHLVPDEGVDNGPVLGTREVPVRATDSLPDLYARIRAVEHELLIEVLNRQLASGQSSIQQS